MKVEIGLVKYGIGDVCGYAEATYARGEEVTEVIFEFGDKTAFIRFGPADHIRPPKDEEDKESDSHGAGETPYLPFEEVARVDT